MGLRVVLLVVPPLILFYDSNGVMTQSKELRNHRKDKQMEKKYHLIYVIVLRGVVAM